MKEGVQVKDTKNVEVLDGMSYGEVVMKRAKAIREGAIKKTREVVRVLHDNGTTKDKHIDRVEFCSKGTPGKAGRLLATKTYVMKVVKHADGKKTVISDRGA